MSQEVSLTSSAELFFPDAESRAFLTASKVAFEEIVAPLVADAVQEKEESDKE